MLPFCMLSSTTDEKALGTGHGVGSRSSRNFFEGGVSSSDVNDLLHDGVDKILEDISGIAIEFGKGGDDGSDINGDGESVLTSA